MLRNPKDHNRETIRYQAEEAASVLEALIAEAEHVISGIMHGEHTQRRAGAGEKFWQFREYHAYDRPQDIDWRQSAKGQRIFVRQKEWQNAQKYVFWCNGAPSMEYSSAAAHGTKAHAAHVMSLALALLYTRAGEQVAPIDALRAGRSETAIERLGEYLLQDKTERPALPETGAIHITRQTGLVLCGDFLDPPETMEQNFETLSALTDNVLVIQILDPAELELPFHGNTVFETMDGSEKIQIDHVASIRTAYREKIRTHIRELQQMCHRRGWPFYLHRSDDNPAHTIRDIWLMLSTHYTSGTKDNPPAS